MSFRNTAKTFVLLAGIGGIFVVLGSLFGGVGGALLGLAIAFAMAGMSAANDFPNPVGASKIPDVFSPMRSLRVRANCT